MVTSISFLRQGFTLARRFRVLRGDHLIRARGLKASGSYHLCGYRLVARPARTYSLVPNYAEASEATAKLTFTGNNVAWVATRGPGRGEAEVDVDGVKTTVDLYSSATQYRKVVFKESGLDPLASHTIEVKLLGTSGRPRVDVDAFVVLS